jgi:OOP family OmpA-OmpF porin
MRPNRHIRSAILPAVLLGSMTLLPPDANAQSFGMNGDEPGIYFGGGATYSRIASENFPNQEDDVQDNRIGYKLIAGLQPKPLVAMEVQYIDFGVAKDGRTHVNADGWSFGGVLTVPGIPIITPYAKAGALYWDADGKSDVEGMPIRSSDNGTDFTYGGGIGFRLTNSAMLRTEYERYELNDTKIDLASANLIFNF